VVEKHRHPQYEYYEVDKIPWSNFRLADALIIVDGVVHDMIIIGKQS